MTEISGEAVKGLHDHVSDWLSIAAWIESSRRDENITVHFDPEHPGVVV